MSAGDQPVPNAAAAIARANERSGSRMETTVGGDYISPSLVDQRRLHDECVAIVGRAGLMVCVAGRIMHLLVFGGDHWGDHIPPMVARCDAFLDSIEGA